MKSYVRLCNYIQGDQKVSVHLMNKIRKFKVMFKMSPVILQTFSDEPKCVLEDCVQNSTVHIPNVFCSKYFIFGFFWYIVICTETL